ncbi:glucose/galactose MFS transporter [Chitinophaga sp. SYP-B3965]|uniref:sugar MFS transporter n=1 Tax=Chitinophaga sp. SYP-B3965 TaxID=2663120 RepID=UPI00129A00EF|nr:sugar MFS transporter [Chitinophaga sp. SYP-B3965]MRG47127.1 glucose/galactose MFS transporter [Chitinophaga sp. SYP-B3965]
MTDKTATVAAPRGGYAQAMAIIATLFFIFGFVTWLNSVLIPFLKQACELTDTAAYLVAFAFYISYFVMAIPSSMILKKIGFPKGMSLGLLTIAIGSAIFIPAAQMRSYPIFLFGLFVQGTGLALLQTASNPYVTILGPIESAAKRISIMGICNKIAGMIGILVLVQLLFSDTLHISEKINSLTGAAKEAELDLLASRLITPYAIMTVVLLLLAFLVRKAHLPEINQEEEVTAGASEVDNRNSVLQVPYLMLGVLCIFLYVGVEVLAIDTLALYGEYTGLAKDIAGKLSIWCLVAFTVGYLIGVVAVPKYIKQKHALMTCAILGMIFTVGALVTKGNISIAFIILLSFAHSLMWPGIWPLAINKLGKFTKIGSALMIMGIAGGAILPLVYGAIVDSIGGDRQIAYVIMIPCYLYILYFAASGHKKGLPA